MILNSWPNDLEFLSTSWPQDHDYSRRSLGITSNLVFSEWERIFANPMATAAAIDRVVHHSVILEFDVPSYRTGVAQQRSSTGGAEPAKIVVATGALPQPKRYLRQVVASDSMLPKLRRQPHGRRHQHDGET